MREIRTPGSVRGAGGNPSSYRDCQLWGNYVFESPSIKSNVLLCREL